MGIASADTRRRALAAYEQGGKTQSEIAAVFGVTLRTFQRWWHIWRAEGRDAPGCSPGRPAVFVGPAAERLPSEVTSSEEVLRYKGSLMQDILNATLANAFLYEEARRRGLIDPLTGLKTRHVLEMKLEHFTLMCSDQTCR